MFCADSTGDHWNWFKGFHASRNCGELPKVLWEYSKGTVTQAQQNLKPVSSIISNYYVYGTTTNHPWKGRRISDQTKFSGNNSTCYAWRNIGWA